MEKEVNDLLKEKFLDQNKFTTDVEQLVLDTELNYIEAIISYCEENNIEFESVGKLISKPLKDKLKAEATELNYLKRTSRSKLFFFGARFFLCYMPCTPYYCGTITLSGLP